MAVETPVAAAGRIHAGPAAHALQAEAVLRAVASSTEGLSSGDAALRAEQFGPNSLRERPGTPVWRLLLDEVLNPLVLILLGAVAVLVAVTVLEPGEGSLGDAALILAIVVLNGALGFVQNYRAQRGIEALRRLEVPEVHVLRDGAPVAIHATDLVPGDVILLEEGDRVPADGRLLRVHDLRVDESSLTGESLPVDKQTAPVPEATPLAERSNMVYLGTAAVAGRARAVITQTGMDTQVGAIAEAVQGVSEGPTPFQREVGTLGRRITGIIGVLIVLIAVLQLTVGGLGLLETFIAAVALAVAAIPEGLPVVMTLALAFGTRRMLERRALVRSLPVVEIIGAADVVCTDKTGTITEGRMTLRRLTRGGDTVEVSERPGPNGEAAETAPQAFEIDGRPVDLSRSPALMAAGLCNNAHHRDDGTFLGDPTEVALLRGALGAGVDLDAWERTDELPFSSERKRMSVVVGNGKESRILMKGAPEVLLDRCTGVLHGGQITPMTAERRASIVADQERLAGQAYRVLALAGRIGGPSDRDAIERDLVFYGLAALADPPRAAAGPALRATAAAGVRVVMITGDNALTASAIGAEIGLTGSAVEGRHLDAMTDDEIVDRGAIFSRVEPIHKLRILDAFRRREHVVVMTGDGVNDAPALKGADVGIAMGIRGTDVARDASDMVLLDDNFATIVAAIEEGRRIAANIRKFLNYLLSGNLAEVLVILVASLFGLLPITAVQILWVNLVTDSGPAVALAVDPATPDIMDQPPRRGPIIGRAMLSLVAGVGVVVSVIVLATFGIGLALFDLQTARTMTFTALVLQEYLRLVVIRVHEHSPLFANPWLVLAVLVSLGLQLVLIYTPLGTLFDAVPLGLLSWGVILAGLAARLPDRAGSHAPGPPPIRPAVSHAQPPGPPAAHRRLRGFVRHGDRGGHHPGQARRRDRGENRPGRTPGRHAAHGRRDIAAGDRDGCQRHARGLAGPRHRRDPGQQHGQHGHSRGDRPPPASNRVAVRGARPRAPGGHRHRPDHHPPPGHRHHGPPPGRLDRRRVAPHRRCLRPLGRLGPARGSRRGTRSHRAAEPRAGTGGRG